MLDKYEYQVELLAAIVVFIFYTVYHMSYLRFCTADCTSLYYMYIEPGRDHSDFTFHYIIDATRHLPDLPTSDQEAHTSYSTRSHHSS